MNHKTIAVLAVVTLCLAALMGVAAAGLNPASYGLPTVDFTAGDNNYYNLTVSVPGKQASAICVKCHTRNPGIRTAYRAANGYNYAGSHFVTQTFTDTRPGGGYNDSNKGLRSAPIYMADNTGTGGGTANLLTTTNGWYGAPKYGYLNAGIPDNTTNRTIGTYPSTSAQIICESCHNVVRNIGPAKLLASGFANGGAALSATLHGAPGTADSTLCVGCHGRMDSGVNAEWKLHPDTAASPWVGTQHHRNTSTASIYAGQGTPLNPANMGTMDPAYYSTAQQMWAVGPGILTAARAMNFTSSPPPAGRISPRNDNAQIDPTSDTVLVCTNCHRAHNADSSAGATILMRGNLPFAANHIGTGTVPTDNATGYWGVRRMEDKGGRSAAFDTTNPICLACHQ